MRTHAPLHIWNGSWDLRENECPCDIHLINWLDEKQIRDATIFHFGTGAHHHVGIECARPERRNAVLGVTASLEEHKAYVTLAINRPDVLRFYTAIFGDIYLLNEKLLPTFDVVTLFHLCEVRREQNDAYGAMTDLEITRLLTSNSAWWAHPVLSKFVRFRSCRPQRKGSHCAMGAGRSGGAGRDVRFASGLQEVWDHSYSRREASQVVFEPAFSRSGMVALSSAFRLATVSFK